VSTRRGKILVIRGGAIGDFVLTLPAISALRSTFFESSLELLAHPRVAELARSAGLIDGYRSIESRPLAGFFARNAKLDPELSDYFESFALIFSYLYDPDEIFRTNVLRTTKAQFIQGPHRPVESEDVHATAVFLKPLEKMAIFDVDPAPKLQIPAVQAAGSWIAAHPGSGSEKKNWPVEKWIELLQRIEVETRHNLLLVGGEADGQRIEVLRRVFPDERLRVIQNAALPEVARQVASCRQFIGHDSGISHIAAATGVSTLVLWGDTNYKVWRPLNENAKVLQAPQSNLQNLTMEQVWQALGEFLGRI
jgi:heptosyltransferase-3